MAPSRSTRPGSHWGGGTFFHLGTVRIRTIKPEFWTNERMAALPEFTRLLAIALLNYADDEGYFYANPTLIRGAIFPFVEESGTIPRAIGELSILGYLRIGKDREGREIGHIVNFSLHQKGDKFKESKLKKLAIFPDSSPTPPRPIPDQSPLDQGSGIRDQGREVEAASPPQPPVSPRALEDETEGITNKPTLGAAIRYFEANSDYTAEEVKAAYLTFEASKGADGSWWWGRRPVGDWRASMESRMGERRRTDEGTPRARPVSQIMKSMGGLDKMIARLPSE